MNLTGGNAGGNTGIAAFTHTLSGKSTYKWKWIPRDMNNDFQPDYQHFPAILFKLNVGVQAWPHQFPPVGLESIGGVANGADWSRNFTGIPGMAPPSNEFAPPRVVLTNYQNPLAVLTLSPSANVGISGTQAGAPGGTSIFIGQTNFAITLSQPDMFGRPDLGDGRNQYAFSSEQPWGNLYIPTATAVTSTTGGGAAVEDTNWMIPLINWYFQPILGSVVQEFTKAAEPGTLFPRTVLGGFTHNSRLVFSPLPSANGAFGDHYLLLQINLQDSMRAKTQIFFDGGAINHPNPDGTPNWWYYWTQAYNPPPNSVYDPTGASRYNSNSDTIYIGNDAFGDWSIRTFNKVSQGPFLLTGWTGTAS